MNSAQSGTYSTQAIVLRTRNLGEKDRVMTLLAPEGKFCAVAKGARGVKSKLAAVSQPFVYARFLVARGRSLDIATQAEIEGAFPLLTTDLLKTAWATYLCELCDLVPEHQPEHELFESLRLALQALNDSESADSSTAAGHWFEAHFLMLLGYTPVIGDCVVCGEKIVAARSETSLKLAFSPILGGTLCNSCMARDPQRLSLAVQSLRGLHQLIRAETPPTKLVEQWQAASRRDLRDALRQQLSSHLDVRLKSKRFLDDVLSDL